MDSASRKNDQAWQKVCDRTQLLKDIRSNGYAVVKAKDLQHLSDERQPRLMVKFDFDSQRPKLFKDHRLNILPLRRGDYVVFRDDHNVCYFKMPSVYADRRPTAYQPQTNLAAFDTLSKRASLTESDAIEQALLSSLLRTFCQTGPLSKTKSGRFGSDKFMLKLPCEASIPVDGSQIEVDAVLESPDAVVLIEAKIGFHQNFHVRQLYYPHCWLRERTKKRIVPVLLCYSNGEFQLTEFKLGEHFGDVELVKQGYFVIEEYVLAGGNIAVIDRNLPSPVEDLGIPFPQADDMDKVVDILQLAQRGTVDPDQLVEIFGFVPRQADYYRNAARYLLFIGKDGKITSNGARLLAERYRINRTELILKSMLGEALRDAIFALQSKGFDMDELALTEIEKIIENIGPESFPRRPLPGGQILSETGSDGL